MMNGSDSEEFLGRTPAFGEAWAKDPALRYKTKKNRCPS